MSADIFLIAVRSPVVFAVPVRQTFIPKIGMPTPRACPPPQHTIPKPTRDRQAQLSERQKSKRHIHQGERP